MNYRHAFHAGNHADVLKHVVLLGLCDALMAKPAPMFFWDVHAGAGVYDLGAEEAIKTGEFESGVARLKTPESLLLRNYLEALEACKAQCGANAYPGSPWLMQYRMRSEDRLVCTELHPEIVPLLRESLKGDSRATVHQANGYEKLRAFLPPRDGVVRLNRGVVLIDPPYEAQLAEFGQAFQMLGEALQRWAQGVYVLWYPIKQRRELARIYREAAALPAKSLLAVELLVREDNSPLRLNGSGLFIWNAPFQFDARVAPALEELASSLADGIPMSRMEWLKAPA